jgi:hypothetical protein
MGLWRGNLRGRLLRRSCHRWEDTIKTDLQEIGFENTDWFHLMEDWWAFVSAVINSWVSWNAANFLDSGKIKHLKHSAPLTWLIIVGSVGEKSDRP